MKSHFRFLMLCALTLSSLQITAQEADEIISKYIEAIGGQDKLTALNTIITEGANEGPYGSSQLTMMKKAPNKNKMLINAMGNEMVFSYDGETAWVTNPWQGGGAPTKLEGDQAKSVPQDDLEDPFINYGEKGHSIKFLGEEDVNDVEHYKVRLTRNDGMEMVYYFDSETYLPSQMKMLLTEGQAKGSIMVVNFSEYKDVDGYMFAHTTERILDGTSQGKYTISKIIVNQDIEDGEFVFPKE